MADMNMKIPAEHSASWYMAKNMVMRFGTSDGKKGELNWGDHMLASVGGAGGTINVGYHETSTEENPIALWLSGSAGVNSKMDYEQYYKEYISMQQQSSNQSGADLYQLQLERFLFFYRQNKQAENTEL